MTTRIHPMSHADAAWLHMDRPTNLMVITSVMWFDGPVDWDRAQELIQQRLVDRFPRFRQKVVGLPRPVRTWAFVDDEEFDLSRHIIRATLPAPGDKAALERFVSGRMSVPLDQRHPLWETFFLDGYGGGAATVTRMSHCIADGIALARVMLSLTDDQPDAGIAPYDDLLERPRRGRLERVVRPVTGAAAALTHEGMETLLHPMRLVEQATSLNELLLLPPDNPTALTGDPVVEKGAVWSEPIPLEDVKAAGHARGATVNDVLVAALAGALRSYLEERGGPVPDIHGVVPFNLRPLDQPLPAELGNRFGLVFLPMPVGIADRDERLAATHRAMQQIKHSAQGPVSFAVLTVTGMMPQQVENLIVSVFGSKGSAVVTNVPGPTQPIYLAGSRVAGCVSWVPSSGRIPLGLSMFSYDGKVFVGVAGDAHLVPHPERIVAAFRAELDALMPAHA